MVYEWEITYEVKYENGHVEHSEIMVVKSRFIGGALKIFRHKMKQLIEEGKVKQYAIWNVGVVEEQDMIPDA